MFRSLIKRVALDVARWAEKQPLLPAPAQASVAVVKPKPDYNVFKPLFYSDEDKWKLFEMSNATGNIKFASESEKMQRFDEFKKMSHWDVPVPVDDPGDSLTLDEFIHLVSAPEDVRNNPIILEPPIPRGFNPPTRPGQKYPYY